MSEPQAFRDRVRPHTLHIGSDHAGAALRDALAEYLGSQGYTVRSYGPQPHDKADYPVVAAALAQAVLAQASDLGILICGTGIGMSIAANKQPGIRAALVHDPITARLAAEHNDAQILCLGARLLATPYAIQCVEAWLHAPFELRHATRLNLLPGPTPS